MLSLLIFARAPVPGRCKTRLIPRLGARGAAWVQRRLLERAVALGEAAAASRAEPLQITIYGAPDAAHAQFSGLRLSKGLRLARQSRGDLGQRMRSAIARHVQDGPVLLIGSDAIGLQSRDLLAAANALKTSDYTLIGAPDGGYVLIGARKPLPHLTGIAWSSGRERAQTLRRLRAAGSVDDSQAARADLDTPRDWWKARRQNQLAPLIHR